MITRKPS